MKLAGSQPAVLLNGRVVRCAFCRTDDYGLPDRQLDEHHFSVRFSDNLRYPKQLVVMLEGVDVTKGCFEAYAGVHGWVALYVKNTHGKLVQCAYGPHAIAEIYRGRVSVYRRTTRPRTSDTRT